MKLRFRTVPFPAQCLEVGEIRAILPQAARLSEYSGTIELVLLPEERVDRLPDQLTLAQAGLPGKRPERRGRGKQSSCEPRS